jgi:sugar (pentulose or hexulose) kinase
MSEKYLIGIDSGTQSTRVIIFTTQGEQICKGIGKHPPLIVEKKGNAEHGEMDVWIGLCDATKDVFSKFKGDPKDIVGIGLSSQRGTFMALDQDCNIIQRPISWMDQRMAYGIEPMPNECDPWYKFLRYYSRPNWFRVNKPDVFDKTYKWLGVGGFLTLKLCGNFIDTIANHSVGWPIDREAWKIADEDWKYECLGIRKDQMARMVRPGEILGYVSSEGSKSTGFPEGCPVIACAGDKQCEQLGAGAIKEGQSYITFGTAVSLGLVGNNTQMRSDPGLSYLTYLAAAPGTWNYEAGLYTGYWLISWFRDNLCKDLAAEAKSTGTSIEDLLNQQAAEIPAGSDGLIVIPDWAAPRSRPFGKGMMIGFDSRHTRAHMFRAIIEGVALQLKVNTDIMCEKIGAQITEIRVGGGGSQSDISMQSTADIFGVPAMRTYLAENCSLGAAICAAVGAGVYPSFEAAVEGMTKISETFYPIPENQKLYDELRESVFIKMYPVIEPILKNLVELTKDNK